jgi:hypothetical protein
VVTDVIIHECPDGLRHSGLLFSPPEVPHVGMIECLLHIHPLIGVEYKQLTRIIIVREYMMKSTVSGEAIEKSSLKCLRFSLRMF